MRLSKRLIMAACVFAAALLIFGCGHKKTPVVTGPTEHTKAEPASKPGNTKAPTVGFPGMGTPDLNDLANSTSNSSTPNLLSNPPAAGSKKVPVVIPPSAKPNAGQVIAVLRAAYRQMGSLKVNGLSESIIKADGKTLGRAQKMRISMLFKRPNMIVVDSGNTRFSTDGKTVYNYAPSAKRYVKGKMSGDVLKRLVMSRPGIGLLGLLYGVDYDKMITSTKLLSDTKIGGRDVYVVSIRLKSGIGLPSGADAVETLWIGKKDMGLYKSQTYVKIKPKPVKGSNVKMPRLIETTLTTTLSSFEPNAGVSTSAFRFNPPAGAKLYESPKPVDISNKPARDISFQWTDGSRKKLSDFRGKIVLLDFWGLPMCEEQLPVLQGISDKLKDHVQLIAVNLNTNKAKVEGHLKKKGYNFPIVFADDALGKIASENYRVIALPTMFIIDEKGIIRHELVGTAKLKEIEGQLSKIK